MAPRCLRRCRMMLFSRVNLLVFPDRQHGCGDATCDGLGCQVRDWFTLIAVDAIGLGRALDLDEGAASDHPDIAGSMLGNKDTISQVQLFLNDYSAVLSQEEAPDARTPIAVVLLAWSATLARLPAELQPPQTGLEEPVQRTMLQRALRHEAALLPWLEQLCTGKVLTDGAATSSTVFRRKVFKDLLLAYEIHVPTPREADAFTLNSIWSTLYTTASPTTSLILAVDYWGNIGRQPLPDTEYPLDPVSLPRFLAAVSGVTSPSATLAEMDNDGTGIVPVREACNHFASLGSVTIPVPPHFYTAIAEPENGKQRVAALADMVLPGRLRIRSGTEGYTVREQGDRMVVKWNLAQSGSSHSGWRTLLEILRVAVGLRDYHDRDSDVHGDRIPLSVADLGISRPTNAVLASGLALFNVALKPVSDVLGSLHGFLLQDKRTGGSAAAEPLITILEVAINVLAQYIQADNTPDDYSAALSALEIITSLSKIQPALTFNMLRSQQFFAMPAKRDSPACELIRKDATGESHQMTLAMLRLITRLCEMSIQSPQNADEQVIRAALHHVNADMWQMLAGWRYESEEVRQEVAVGVCGVFEVAVGRPWGDKAALGAGAKTVIEIFITSATGTTYRSLVELLLGLPATRMAKGDRAIRNDASITAAATLLSSLLRIASQLEVPATSLPASVFTVAIGSKADRAPLVEVLLSKISALDVTEEVSTIITRLVTTYLTSTAQLPSKSSLVSQLANVQKTCDDIATVAATAETTAQRVAAWKLLNAIMLSQPGAHVFCIGSRGELAEPLKLAMAELKKWQELAAESPAVLSALLGFMISVITSPALFSVADQIHNDQSLWTAIFAIVNSQVEVPKTITLSRADVDLAANLTEYAHAVQVRASATAVLAAEVDLLVELEDEDEANGKKPETRIAKRLVLSAFQKQTEDDHRLAVMALDASRNLCEPEPHLKSEAILRDLGIRLDACKTTKGLLERSYGIRYLYGECPVSALNWQADCVQTVNRRWSTPSLKLRRPSIWTC